ncbi:Protein of unknown function, partial [Gryllus bimaculatus]
VIGAAEVRCPLRSIAPSHLPLRLGAEQPRAAHYRGELAGPAEERRRQRLLRVHFRLCPRTTRGPNTECW